MDISPFKLAIAGGAAAIILGGVLSHNQTKAPAKVVTLPVAIEAPAPSPEAATPAALPPGAPPVPMSGPPATQTRESPVGMPLRPAPSGQQMVGTGSGSIGNAPVRLTPPPPPPRAANQPPELKEQPREPGRERDR
jgi:hypothetical protein